MHGCARVIARPFVLGVTAPPEGREGEHKDENGRHYAQSPAAHVYASFVGNVSLRIIVGREKVGLCRTLTLHFLLAARVSPISWSRGCPLRFPELLVQRVLAKPNLLWRIVVEHRQVECFHLSVPNLSIPKYQKSRAALSCCARSTRRFPANQIPALRFHVLLNEEASEVELALIR